MERKPYEPPKILDPVRGDRGELTRIAVIMMLNIWDTLDEIAEGRMPGWKFRT